MQRYGIKLPEGIMGKDEDMGPAPTKDDQWWTPNFWAAEQALTEVYTVSSMNGSGDGWAAEIVTEDGRQIS